MEFGCSTPLALELSMNRLMIVSIALLSRVASADSVPLLWNYTKQAVNFTICDPSKRNSCEYYTFESGQSSLLLCDAPRCTVAVQATGKIKYQKVSYSYGMGVTLDSRGLRSFTYK